MLIEYLRLLQAMANHHGPIMGPQGSVTASVLAVVLYLPRDRTDVALDYLSDPGQGPASG